MLNPAGVVYVPVPFGTVKQCEVADVFQRGNTSCLVLFAEGGRREATVVLGDKASAAGVVKGDRGTITFTRGGPLGGYWKFEKTV